jgi:prolyl-tRNA editing enzyme YbaK/EbsC (Cys-tRNA(Pro) deacylase)
MTVNEKRLTGSLARVEEAARHAGLSIEIRRMDGSTRTAEEAAAQCGCAVAQIVKSLVFEGEGSGRLYLFLVAGSNRLNPDKAAAAAGEGLRRADPKRVRERTGFAIGGVAPIGHLEPITAFADRTLIQFDMVWAAAGTPDAVFVAEPRPLIEAAAAVVADIAD